ncbi:MAG: DUF3035 domain-containing protein [Alphaproteobacteria bacterium]|nr:MAG: DUF3035 domain-containing protein [Alphaproteobacteria bacterium]
MRAMTGLALVAAMALSACSSAETEPRLMHLRSATQGPDEFSILPTKPLEMPTDFAALPAPTPGGRNRADRDPDAEIATALGGRPAATRGAVPAADRAIVAQATRFGLQEGIRATLAAEDLAWRRAHDGRLLERVFRVNVYFRAYAPMALDKYAELDRWRRAGVKTVAAPPQNPEAAR